MISLRKSNERGLTKIGWLESRHSFSFGNYYDPEYMGFGKLRVINDDIIAPGGGFPSHPHRDMEIITYVLSGSLSHKDSLGNGSTIIPGEIQRMSAGRGITHSEFNGSDSAPVHLLQIWILPDTQGVPPSYDQQTIDRSKMQNTWLKIAAKNDHDAAISLHQDVNLYATLLAKGQHLTFKADSQKNYWLHVAVGGVQCASEKLTSGDAMAFSKEGELIVEGISDTTEILLFEGV